MLIPYMHIQFSIEFEKPIYSHFPEALFRGGFGNKLKKIVCINNKEECRNCFLASNCIFSIIFHPTIDKNKIYFKNINTAPPPYSFFVNKKEKSKEQLLELLLFNKCFIYLKQIIFTFIKMGEEGIGKKKNKFKIKSIVDMNNGKIIYDFKNSSIEEPTISHYTLYCKNGIYAKNKTIKLKLMSPLKIIKKGNRLEQIEYCDLIKQSLIRISLLNAIYGDGENIKLDINNVLDKAKKVKLVENKVYWNVRKRFSGIQNKMLYMGGLMGELVYKGKVDAFKDILNGAKIFGIGKNTTFGYGRINYNIEQ